MGISAADVLAEHGIEVEEETLEHYGVPGMKWGRRKAAQRKAKKEARIQTEMERLSVKTMSDDELKAKINRLKLEKEFQSLTTPEINRGQKIVGGILSDVGKSLAKEYVTAQANKRIYGNVGGLKAAVAAAEAAAKK